MPYIISTSVFAAPGHQGEVRQLLEERVADIQAAKWRASLLMTAFGLDPALYINILFDSLEQADAFRASPQFPGSNRAYLAKIGPLLRQPTRNVLAETLVPILPGATPRYNLLARLATMPGNIGQLTALVKARLESERASGVRVGASRTVAGEPGLQIARQFESLAELQKWQDAAANDASRQEFLKQVSPLFAAPVRYEMRELLMAMP